MQDIQLEVEIKVAKITKENQDDIKTKMIIGKDDISFEDLETEYRRLTIKIKDIDARGDFDGVHTVIYLPYGAYLVNLPYDHFNFLYDTLSGVQTKKMSDFKFSVLENKSKRKKFREDEDE